MNPTKLKNRIAKLEKALREYDQAATAPGACNPYECPFGCPYCDRLHEASIKAKELLGII